MNVFNDIFPTSDSLHDLQKSELDKNCCLWRQKKTQDKRSFVQMLN
jgi:hypothetical protein